MTAGDDAERSDEEERRICLTVPRNTTSFSSAASGPNRRPPMLSRYAAQPLGNMSARCRGQLAAAHRDDELALYRVGGQTSGASSARLKATMLAHWAWLSMLLVGGAGAAGYWVRRHLHHCEDTPASRAQD